MGLSNQLKYPITKHSTGPQRKNIGKIREALRKLCGLDGNPFLPTNPTDGYKLKCELIDKTKAGDQRAKERAPHVQYNDNKHPFDREEGPVQDWMDKHDK